MNNQKGVVFVLSLGMMFILLTFGLTFAYITRSDIFINRNQEFALQAFYYAETGAAQSIAEILNGVDVDGDGLGNIPYTDIDLDGLSDYYVNYDVGLGRIRATGLRLSANRTIELVIGSNSSWTGAFQSGGNIDFNAPAGGTIAGNLDAVGNIHPNVALYDTTGYTVTANNTGLTIPTPTFAEYANPANFPSQNHYILPDCTTVGLTPPDGIYYITGNCTIAAGSTGPFNLNGSFIVEGSLTISQVTGSLTITPADDVPAVIAGTNFTATSIVSATFGGLVYASNNISFTTFAFNTTVNGALVAGNDITFTNIPSSTINFDTALNPPYFTGGGGGGLTLTSWKGHT